MSAPEEAPTDELTQYVLATYAGIAKGRRYLPAFGAPPQPLPISAREIDEWLVGHPTPLERRELDACVFALDVAERAAGREA